ncbi:MAG: uroporphyrinogen decarboxylase family protein [Promethearchaeota archaeon]
MNSSKVERVHGALHGIPMESFPIFTSATPQFMNKCLGASNISLGSASSWRYCVDLDLDVVQVGHPSFYPVKVLELESGSKYIDDFGRTHVITDLYDEFCAPFPLQDNRHVDIREIRSKWDDFTFPNPADEKWFEVVETTVEVNGELDDPLSIWGVINGPFEPTWQLLSDGWPEFFILARKDKDLALEIIERVTGYCIEAGQAMIDHGVDAIRIGDDYALNGGLMVSTDTWRELVYPFHVKLVNGLKQKGGSEFPVILHSDGDISSILHLLGEGGIDALNPIQPGAMDFGDVVSTIGHELSMTGAFDLRYFLEPLNERTKVILRNETTRLFNIINEFNDRAPAGRTTGFCIGPSHQVQPASHVDTFEYWVQVVHELNAKRSD